MKIATKHRIFFCLLVFIIFILVGIPGYQYLGETWGFDLTLGLPAFVIAFVLLYWFTSGFWEGRPKWMELTIRDVYWLFFIPFLVLLFEELLRFLLAKYQVYKITFGWPDIFLFIFAIAYLSGSAIILKKVEIENQFWKGIQRATYPAALSILSATLSSKSEYFAPRGGQLASLCFVLSAIITFLYHLYQLKENEKRVILASIVLLIMLGMGLLICSINLAPNQSILTNVTGLNLTR